MSETVTPLTDTSPGAVTLDRFIEALETVNQERTGIDNWCFNDGQRDVLRHDSGPLHVTAGPGAGKTEVSIAKVAKWLVVDGVDPQSIVLTTFTEKAAIQLQQRLTARVEALGMDEIEASDVWVGTAHQVQGDIMREFRYDDYTNVQLLDEDAQRMFIQQHVDFVGKLVNELNARDVAVHNPRNKAFDEQDEIQLALAALRRCVDPGGEWAEDNVYPASQVQSLLDEWDETFEDYAERGEINELQETVEPIASEIRSASPGALDFSLLEVFHRLRAAEPLSGWTQGANRDPERARRLGKLTSLITSLETVADGIAGDRSLTRTSHDEYESASTRFLRDFYWMFCAYLTEVDLDDPEDPHDQFPEGYVQMMTVHQAKGLEFPVVFVLSLSRTVDDDRGQQFADRVTPYTDRTPPADPVTRERRDLIRQFYVAHSRAEEQLVLAGSDRQVNDPPDSPLPAFGYVSDRPFAVEDFTDEQVVSDVADAIADAPPVGLDDEPDIPREYSIVGDVLAYRRCKRQYGFQVEYDHEPAQAIQLFAGQATHRTLDYAHRHYAGDIEGVDGSEVPTRDELREYFDDVVETLRDNRTMPMSDQAVERVFDQIADFTDRVGPELFPRVEDTECTLRHAESDFVLTGQVDVLSRSDGGGVEIVDYKAGTRPKSDDRIFQDYRQQLQVYAGLYLQRTGELPERAVIYFLSEDTVDEMGFEVVFDHEALEEALTNFRTTVDNIEMTRANDSWGEISHAEKPGDETCDVCDFRYDCPVYDE